VQQFANRLLIGSTQYDEGTEEIGARLAHGDKAIHLSVGITVEGQLRAARIVPQSVIARQSVCRIRG
jgi:hypothetical protein